MVEKSKISEEEVKHIVELAQIELTAGGMNDLQRGFSINLAMLSSFGRLASTM
jgi:Asp-tRNA(Asn)/Glu-tRNA(Gln) amidotransferase C subunit